MRRLLINAFVLNVVLCAVGWYVSPERVATHFDGEGRPDGWMSRTTNALIMIGVDGLIFLMFYHAPWLVRRSPASWLSLPNKDYWLRPENRARLDQVFTREMYLFGAATLGFLFIVELLAIQANLTQPVRLASGPFWVAFGLFMLFTLFWCVRLMSALGVSRREG